jgi:hypothetical protein
VKLRDGLVALRPEADDSAAVPPSPGGGATSISALLTHRQTLAYFDLRVAGEPETFNHKGEGGKAQALLSVLQAKDAQYVYDEEAVRRAAGAPHSKPLTPQDDGAPSAASANDPCGTEVDEPERSELDRWRTRVGNVDRRLEHARRWLRLRMRTSAGVALLKLEAARDAMQPPLNLIDPDESPLAMGRPASSHRAVARGTASPHRDDTFAACIGVPLQAPLRMARPGPNGQGRGRPKSWWRT